MKLSFDFDSTLTLEGVQNLAKTMIEDGNEVWIVTSRFEHCDSSGNKVSNKELFEIADEVGITRDHIHFCNMSDKYEFLYGKGFLFHLDDDAVELEFIRSETNVFPIHRSIHNNWWDQCQDLVRILGNK